MMAEVYENTFGLTPTVAAISRKTSEALLAWPPLAHALRTQLYVSTLGFKPALRIRSR